MNDVSNQELCRFLDSIMRTADATGLKELSQIASSLLNKVNTHNQSVWKEEEWRNFIQPLVLKLNDTIGPKVEEKLVKIERSSQQKVLILDDDIELLNLLKESFEENNYLVFIATTLKRGVKLFYDHHPDLVIMDTSIRNESSVGFITRISTIAKSTFTPVIVIGEETSAEVKKEIYDAGAHDFIEKPIEFDLFYSIVENRMRQKDWFKKRVMIDELTQVYNRASLFEIWTELNLKFQDDGESFCFALLDLDHFKKVNDHYGHAIGDMVLSNFSKLISNKKRYDDYLVRYGGEEFLLILPNTEQAEAILIVQDLLKTFMNYTHITDETELQLSFTAGVAQMKPSIQSMEQLIIRSDLALYYGKQNGRQCVYGYTNEMQKDNELINKEVSLRIAVVDDDRIIQRLLSDQLSKLEIDNYQVEVNTFSQGESFLKTNWYKSPGKYIILLDGVMPGMDGLEVLEEIRKTENEKDIGIVMLTGRQKDKDIVKALELGADDYITKPFSLEQLEARIKRLVNRLF